MVTVALAKKIRYWHEHGGLSIRQVAMKAGLSLNTAKKYLTRNPELPIHYQRPPKGKVIDPYKNWLSAALEADRGSPHNRCTARSLHNEIRQQGYGGCYSGVADFVRAWGKDYSPEVTDQTEGGKWAAKSKRAWMEWLYDLERKPRLNQVDMPMPPEVLAQLSPAPHSPRVRTLVILAKRRGFSQGDIAKHLGISRRTVSGYLEDFNATGGTCLYSPHRREKKSDDLQLKEAVFTLLHEPPSLSGFNRTTWRLIDLRAAMKVRGVTACSSVISTVIKNAGYRWRKARVVLTSNDPEYRQKLMVVQNILMNLKLDERFFSIDEYGPFSIKMKAGRVLSGPNEQPTVPQWQKSKGWMIMTAALELSTNQVTHFYCRAKNTQEMIKLSKMLIAEYHSMRKLYLSWDAASWHMSKELNAFVSANNSACIENDLPEIELAPLPASAQFLNVIESVFSGMARAIIHRSDYQSVDDAQAAIDRYFKDRNEFFLSNPKRAGQKIWGKERSTVEFAASNNCKDPEYR